MRNLLKSLSYTVMVAGVLIALALLAAPWILDVPAGSSFVVPAALYVVSGFVVGGVLYLLVSIDERLERLEVGR